MTATPRHYNPHQRDREGESKLVFSMDKPDVYGEQIYRLTFAEAARRGIICGYKVIISVITSEMVTNELLSRGEVLVNGNAVMARQVANQIALRDAVEKFGTRKIFTFHKTVKSAESFVAKGSEGVRTHLPDFKTFHVNGTMPTARREREMRDFRAAPLAVMSNARCLTEGVDVPAVDMVAFLSPRRSLVDIVQATGRAMRRSPGKTTGYVLVPLYVELAAGENVEAAVSRTNFDEVWDVLQTMQEQDDVLAEYIRQMATEKGRTGKLNGTPSEQIEFIGEAVSVDTLRNSIQARCFEELFPSWDEWFGSLQRYQEREGHCIVPRDHIERSYKLGQWVGNQRMGKNNMPEDRLKRLDALGFVWDPFTAAWEEGFSSLMQFYHREQHCRVPQRHIESGYRLGQWISSQRTIKNSMSDDRRQRLDALGFMWDPLTASWAEAFAMLKQFYERERHCLVPQRHIESGYRLGQWVSHQRSVKKSIPNEWLERLDALGFVWDPHKAAWEKGFAALKKFHKREGHFLVPATHLESGHRLGQWVGEQRHELGSMSEDRRQRLDSLGFVWDTLAAAWEKGFAILKLYKEREGHCLVPATHIEKGFRLGMWVGTQRNRRDSLLMERQQRLDGLGYVWDIRSLKWEEGFSALKQFYKRESHCCVPQRHIERKYKLGQWVGVQRNRPESMSADRRLRLDALGFVWDPLAAAWDEGFAALKQYKEREGNCLVPATHIENGYRLGKWVNYKRSEQKIMSEHRRQQLDSLGFIWNPFSAAWEEGFATLKSYKEREGHCRVPQNHIESGFRLGIWVSTQRRKRDCLTTDRRKCLAALGFIWFAR